MSATTSVPDPSGQAVLRGRGPGFYRRWWRRLASNRLSAVAAVIVAVVVATAAFAPYLAPADPTHMNFGQFLEPPSAQHIFGTDEAGRDVLSRVIYGARVSISVGILATGFGAVLGVTMGLCAGYYGGPFDAAVAWLIDVLLSFPGILLAVLIAAVLGAGLVSIIIAIGTASIPTFARLARSSALAVRQREYVEAGRAAGAGDLRILLRHILRNSFGPILVYATIVVGRAILTSAALSYIGIGVPPPTPEWGAMVSAGQTSMRVAPHAVLFPGIAIVVTVLGFNLLGDSLKDAIDPTG